MPHTRYYKINSPSVINETIEGESVIINLDTGIYYSLDNVGAIIWDALENRHSVADIAAFLASHYQINAEDVETTINDLINKLLNEQLIILQSENETISPVAPLSFPAEKQTPFVKPVLHKFGDMQDLLLLDPIHEVDEAGWPYTKPENTA
jgi:hypothetical protein